MWRLPANVVFFGEVDSTNALAERLMASWLEEEQGPLPETLLVASSQTAGRGRGSRSWVSPKGGLYATWLGWLPTAALRWLPLAAGMSLQQAVLALVPKAEVKIKWPNDLHVSGKKLGGILCRSRLQGDQAWALVGFGVNVLVTPVVPDGRRQAISLAELGFSGTLEMAQREVLARFLAELPGWLRGGEPLLQSWLAAAAHRLGDELEVQWEGRPLRGSFAGLSPEGLLQLEVGDGLLSVPAPEVS